MGSAAGRNAGGHGVGNCDTVKGDNSTGYLDKSHKMTTNTSWEHADRFEDSFNSYNVNWRQHMEENISINGNGNVVFRNVNVGRDFNMGVPPAPSENASVDDASPPPTVSMISLAAVSIPKATEEVGYTEFGLIVTQGIIEGVEFAPHLDVVIGNYETHVDVTKVNYAGGRLHVRCTTTANVVMQTVFGEFCIEGTRSTIPFNGRVTAHSQAPDPAPAPAEGAEPSDGAEAEGDNGTPEPMARLRIAVGEAFSPHRVCLNHRGKCQAEWDNGASMNFANWEHYLEFWAYPTQQPGTIRIAVGEAFSPHRVCLNHRGKSQTEWDNGASMNFANWKHYLEFWAYPTQQPGTIRIAVGEAFSPHRVCLNHRGKCQAEWDNGASMNFANWKHYLEFWVFPINA
eukprot:TRINITY_DN7039_c0_g1_i5.p1 TRINITY_DN7039_c0_g1~~TRINITY_DN7039_c0_g1_i5.p1  ORF type:complete len:399 (-),score=3.15 TRINITY_DN7039_c0_g1_i5:362-1558(-)